MVFTGTASIYQSRRKALYWAAFACVMLLGLLVRIWRISGPYEHFDEQIAVQMSVHLESSPGWDTNWKDVVRDFSKDDQYNFSAYVYATHLFSRAARPLLPAEWADERNGLYVHRLFSALLGTGVVLMSMVIARRIGGGGVGFFAGLLIALNPQLVQDSHYARPEAFMTALVVALVWLALHRITFKGGIAMGLICGFLTATKVSNLIFLAGPAIAIALDIFRYEEGSVGRKIMKLLGYGLVLTLGCAVGWGIGVPYALIHWDKYVAGIQLLSAQYNGAHPPHSFADYSAVWPMLWAYYRAAWGWPLLVAVVGGVGVVLWRRHWKVWAVMILPLVLEVVIFGSLRVFFERNLSMVVPSALMLAAAGIVAVFHTLQDGKVARYFAASAAALFMSMPSAYAVYLFIEQSLKPETQFEAFLDDLKRDFPTTRQIAGALLFPTELDRIDHELNVSNGPMLYLYTDPNDEFTIKYASEMGRRFHMMVVGEFDGAFASYPTCTLTVSHGPVWRVCFLYAR
jgi:hypothetical protein